MFIDDTEGTYSWLLEQDIPIFEKGIRDAVKIFMTFGMVMNCLLPPPPFQTTTSRGKLIDIDVKFC